MDRRIFYRDELLFEGELMEIGRFAYEALGFAMLDVLGSATVAAGFPCAQTTVASLSFLLGPGRIYAMENLDPTVMGQTGGVGGLAADTVTDHNILKQALYRDTRTLGPVTAPGTVGQSKIYLVEAQFTEADDAPASTQFYNTAAPLTPVAAPVTNARRDIVAVQIKAGTAATTGSQVAPTADAGWIPLYEITVAYGQTTIVAANIAVAAGAPFVSVGNPVPVRAADNVLTIVAGVLTIDWNRGNEFTCLMSAAITSVVHQNRPPAGKWQEIIIDFVGDGTTRVVTGLGSADHKWMGATGAAAQPTFVFTAGYENTVTMVAKNGVARQKCSFPGISAS